MHADTASLNPPCWDLNVPIPRTAEVGIAEVAITRSERHVNYMPASSRYLEVSHTEYAQLVNVPFELMCVGLKAEVVRLIIIGAGWRLPFAKKSWTP